MNVFQATLVFACFVAAKGTFPAVIFGWRSVLSRPSIVSLSDNEQQVGFHHLFNDATYFACPLDHNQREENAIPEVLVRRKIVTAEKISSLDDLPICELQPKVSSEEVIEDVEYSQYSIGYKVYLRRIDHNKSDFRPYSSRDGHAIAEVFTLKFNTVHKKTISVEYELGPYSRFISTASNDKLTFAYEKNVEICKFDLDYLYHNFIDQILPQMVKEKSNNQLAHALGIQKVQLAPKDDFVLDTWKMATYWNINTIPMWRVILLRWNAIEIYIRKLIKRDIDIKVITGASGTLELVEPYYENDTDHKLHVPKYVWKLIPRTYPDKEAILIVMHNDPFTEHQQPLCEDICAINGWLVSNNDYRTGLVYCCKMTEQIAQTLGYSNDMKNYGVYGFTRASNGTEELKKMSRILSDRRDRLYDW